jgi:hypothetical protein
LNDLEDAELIVGSVWGDERLDLRIHKELLNQLFSIIEIMINDLYKNLPQNQSQWSKR